MCNVLKRLIVSSTAGSDTSNNEFLSNVDVNASFSPLELKAQELLHSSLIPKHWKNIPDLVEIIQIAYTLNLPESVVAENLFLVNGKKAWKSTFIISCINSSKNFDGVLKFEMTGNKNDDSYGCIAFIRDTHGDKVYGTEVTVKMAKDEGWWSYEGSKWPTLTEQMLKYRSAAFFGRLYASDVMFGFQSIDEVNDTTKSSNEVEIDVDEDLNNIDVIQVDELAQEIEKVEAVENVNTFDNDELNNLNNQLKTLGFELGEIIEEKEKIFVKAYKINAFSDFSMLKQFKFRKTKFGYKKDVTKMFK